MKNFIQFTLLFVTFFLLSLVLLGCEKEKFEFAETEPAIPLAPEAPHTDDGDAWEYCGVTRSYPLMDSAGNTMPAGYVAAGKVRIAANMDSLRLEIQMNAYWNVTAAEWRVGSRTAALASQPWQHVTFAAGSSNARIMVPRPKGRIAAIQMNVQGQRFNLMGLVNYCGEMSPYADVCADGTRCINFLLPPSCDAGPGVPRFAAMR